MGGRSPRTTVLYRRSLLRTVLFLCTEKISIRSRDIVQVRTYYGNTVVSGLIGYDVISSRDLSTDVRMEEQHRIIHLHLDTLRVSWHLIRMYERNISTFRHGEVLAQR
jgi:hypothetical protein